VDKNDAEALLAKILNQIQNKSDSRLRPKIGRKYLIADIICHDIASRDWMTNINDIIDITYITLSDRYDVACPTWHDMFNMTDMTNIV